MNKLILVGLVLANVMLCGVSYETPKPTKWALKCLIDVYRTEDFLRCGSQVSAKWQLNDEGNHGLKQKCCSIFDLWDCIDSLAVRNCTKHEYKEVRLFKEKLIAAANKNECQAFSYLSNECAHEETENIIL